MAELQKQDLEVQQEAPCADAEMKEIEIEDLAIDGICGVY